MIHLLFVLLYNNVKIKDETLKAERRDQEVWRLTEIASSARNGIKGDLNPFSGRPLNGVSYLQNAANGCKRHTLTINNIDFCSAATFAPSLECSFVC